MEALKKAFERERERKRGKRNRERKKDGGGWVGM